MKKAVLQFTIVFCFTASTIAQNNSVAQKQDESEEYNVYKTVLEKMLVTRKTKRFAVYKSTSGKSVGGSFVGGSDKIILLSPGRQNEPVEPETIENYNSLNRESIELRNNFGLDEKVLLVTDEELKPFQEMLKVDVTGKSYRDALFEKYGTTIIIRLSRVGFNKSKDQALIHVEHFCGALCAGGEYIILSKRDKQWMIVNGLSTWIS